MVVKPFRILSSPSRALKGHGSKGSWVAARLPLAGGFVYFPKFSAGAKGDHMALENPEDSVLEIIAATELSLSVIGFMHYYLVQLPQHQRNVRTKIKKTPVQ